MNKAGSVVLGRNSLFGVIRRHGGGGGRPGGVPSMLCTIFMFSFVCA